MSAEPERWRAVAPFEPDEVSLDSEYYLRINVSNGGIEGKVVMGPMCPVERIDRPCPDKPFEASIEIQNQDNQDNHRRIRSGKDGRFRVDLTPGKYKLTPMAPNPGAPPRPPGPQSVTVESGKYTQVTIKYDSGIR